MLGCGSICSKSSTVSVTFFSLFKLKSINKVTKQGADGKKKSQKCKKKKSCQIALINLKTVISKLFIFL